MTFISYAQNFEDVILWRALKHIEVGFYIDVGANDPKTDSVTQAFYNAGWRGMNIEPVSHWFKRLQESRLRDINLQLAIGKKQGAVTLFEIPRTGLSTAKEKFVEYYETEKGYQSQKLDDVPLDTLTNLCEQYHIAPIHFLKIDVEGMEKDVLEGIDFTKIRPWIVLVEAILPGREVECYVDWEFILLDGGYQYVYCDGVNRYYVANEHSELLDKFRYPPNVFDNFVLNRHQEIELRANNYEQRALEAESRVTEFKSEIQKIRARAEKAENDLDEANRKVEHMGAVQAKYEELNNSSHYWWGIADELDRELKSIYSSKSWRVTWPLRKLRQWVKFFPQIWVSLFKYSLRISKRIVGSILLRLIRFVLQHPRIKHRAKQWLSRCPKLEANLKVFFRKRQLTYGTVPPSRKYSSTPGKDYLGEVSQISVEDDTKTNTDPIAAMTPRAHQIYKNLMSSVKAEKRKIG